VKEKQCVVTFRSSIT